MTSFFSGLANQAQGLIAEKMGKGATEGEVPPTEGGEVPLEGAENGEVPPEGGAMGSAMGFMGGIMQKANAVKGAVAEKAGGLGAGNLQGMTAPMSMAGGVMGQVQGLIPGMKREEDVPDPAPPAEGEYAEYTEEQYAEQGYTEEQYTE